MAAASAARVGYVHAVPVQNFINVETIDGAERIQPVDGRNGAFVLDIGQPAQGDDEFVVVVTRRNLIAGFFHVPIPQIQAFARPLQLLSSFFHAMIPSLGAGGRCRSIDHGPLGELYRR